MEKEKNAMEKEKNAMDKEKNAIERLLRYELATANAKLLKMTGNLSIRGLIEAFEGQLEFKEARKQLQTKVTITKADGSLTTEIRQPSRKVLWTEVLKKSRFSKLLQCVNEIEEGRTQITVDSIALMINSLYQTASKNVHKYLDDDDEPVITIRRGANFSFEVLNHFILF